MTETAALDAELVRRWGAMLASVAAGVDIPPGQRWRTEGLMESLVLLGARTREEIQQAMAEAFSKALGRSLADDLGPDWQRDYPFPEIPFFMRRAPVHRGGPD